MIFFDERNLNLPLMKNFYEWTGDKRLLKEARRLLLEGYTDEYSIACEHSSWDFQEVDQMVELLQVMQVASNWISLHYEHEHLDTDFMVDIVCILWLHGYESFEGDRIKYLHRNIYSSSDLDIAIECLKVLEMLNS